MRKKILLKQKLLGILLIAIALLVMKVSHDGTTAVLLIPLGVCMIFTKTKCLID